MSEEYQQVVSGRLKEIEKCLVAHDGIDHARIVPIGDQLPGGYCAFLTSLNGSRYSRCAYLLDAKLIVSMALPPEFLANLIYEGVR